MKEGWLIREHLLDTHKQPVARELQTYEALESLHDALHAITDPDPESVRDA